MLKNNNCDAFKNSPEVNSLGAITTNKIKYTTIIKKQNINKMVLLLLIPNNFRTTTEPTNAARIIIAHNVIPKNNLILFLGVISES